MDEIKKDFKRYAILDKHLDDTKIDRYINFINNYNSSVIEERSTNFREIDVFSRLIMDRIIFLGSEINSNTANIIVAQLLYLDSTGTPTAVKFPTTGFACAPSRIDKPDINFSFGILIIPVVTSPDVSSFTLVLPSSSKNPCVNCYPIFATVAPLV